MPSTDLALFKQQFKFVFEGFGWPEFRQKRTLADSFIRREAYQTLGAALNPHGDDVDIQSADLEWELGKAVKVLMMKPTKIDAYSLDKREGAVKDVEDIRVWLAGEWLTDDDRHALSRSNFEQMWRYGICYKRMTYEMPKEPSEGDKGKVKLERHKDEDAAAYSLRKRKAYFQESSTRCFDWVDVSPLEMAHWPLGKPVIYFQDSLVPWEEAKKLKNDAGDKLSMDELKKVAFVGSSIPTEQYVPIQTDGKSVHLTIRAAKELDSDDWRITELIHGGDLEKGALELHSDVVPMGRSPFFHAAGGNELTTEHDAEHRFRPGIHPLLVDIQEANFIDTVVAQLAARELADEEAYVDLSVFKGELTPQMQQFMDGAGLTAGEGAGAHEWRIRKPEVGSGEIVGLPHLERWPIANKEYFNLRREQVERNIERHRVSRFQTGEASSGDLHGGVNSFLDQKQASGLNFEDYLSAEDSFTKDWLKAKLAAISFWDKGKDKDAQKPYPWRTTGDEPLLKKPVEAGEEVEITAEKLTRPFILVVTTSGTTQAEEALEQQMADVAYEKGRMTRADWLRATGADDPERYDDELEADRRERLFQPTFDSILIEEISTLFAALGDVPVEKLAPAMPTGDPMAVPAVPTTGGGGGTPNAVQPRMVAESFGQGSSPMQGFTG